MYRRIYKKGHPVISLKNLGSGFRETMPANIPTCEIFIVNKKVSKNILSKIKLKEY